MATNTTKRTEKGNRVMGLMLTDPTHPEVQEIIQHLRETVTNADMLSDEDLIYLALQVLGGADPLDVN